MKTFFAIVALSAASVTSAFAAKSPAAKTPAVETADTKAVASFNADFKGATAIWNNEKDYEEVLFMWNNKLMDAFYDKDGNLIGTFHEVDKNELPGKAAGKIASWYKGYEVKYLAIMENNDQDPLYYVTVQSPAHLRILEVDKNGEVREFKTVR
jgi:hypothetical protein